MPSSGRGDGIDYRTFREMCFMVPGTGVQDMVHYWQEFDGLEHRNFGGLFVLASYTVFHM